MTTNIRFRDWIAEEMEPSYQVARLRMLRGLTQAELAKEVGTRQPSIARVESGKREPKISFLRRIAKALNARLEIRFVPNEEMISGTIRNRAPQN